MATEQASLRTALAYSLSVGGVAFALNALGPLQDIYARYYGLEFSQMALASIITSCITAIANPLVGILADRYCPALISRKWWVISAFTLLVLTERPLLLPSSHVSTASMTFWLTAVMLCWVLFDAPHLAWGEHIAGSYDSRTRMFAVRSFICNVGALIFYALPLLPVFPTRDVNPDTLRYAQIFSYVLWIPIVYITVRWVPNANGPPVSRHESIVGSLRLVMSNRPFRLLLGITILRTVAEAMWGSIAYIAFDYYYGLGSRLAMMYFVSLLVSTVSASALTRMTVIMGKRRTLLVVQLTYIGLLGIPTIIQPHWEFTYVVLLAVLAAVMVNSFCHGVVSNAILADTIDYGRWKHRTSQAAGYFAVFAFFGLIAGGIGGSLALGIMGRMGFSAKGITNVTEARHALQLVFFLLPALIMVLTLALVAKLPICARRAALIRRRIEFRAKAVEGCSAAE